MSQSMIAPPLNVWPGRITQIIDPHYFWMHFGSSELMQQFEQLQRGIQQFCKSNWTPVGENEKLDYGQVVLVDTGIHDGTQFRRGQVTRMTSTNSVDVFFVDYGQTELRTLDSICANFPPNFKTWPPQAVRCSLAGIVPISKNWTSRATKTFQRLTEGKMFNTLVLYGEPGFCGVSLYPSESDNGRSVSHLLLDEDVAMPIEGIEVRVPEYFGDFMAAMIPPDNTPSYEDQEERKHLETQIPHHAPSKPTDRYVPPQRKNVDFSLSTGFAPHDSSSYNKPVKTLAEDMMPSNMAVYDNSKSNISSKQSMKGLHLNTTLDKNKPVNDFFPFENVSTYPPTPTSPMKSPSKSPGNQSNNFSSNVENSYFTRTPAKQESADMSLSNPKHISGTSREANNCLDSKYQRHHDHRFAPNLDNLPSPGRQESHKSSVPTIGTSLIDGQSAAANLEPSFLSSTLSDKRDSYQPNGRSPKSQVNYQTPSTQHYDTSYRPTADPTRVPNNPPFYPPNVHYGDQTNTVVSSINSSMYGAQLRPNLVPPGFYASSASTNHDRSNHGNCSSQTGYQNDNYGYGLSAGNWSSKKDNNGPYYRNSDFYNQDYDSQYVRNGGYNSPQNYNKSPDQVEYRHMERNQSQVTNTSNTSSDYGNKSRPHLKVRLPETPPKTASFEKKVKTKMSPVSPDSAGIGEFNISDIDHTQFTSADYFHQRVREEKMIALQEEAEDIAAETAEQSKLVEMARYGAYSNDQEDLHVEEDTSDIFQQIANEIASASTVHSKEYEELRKSPIKRNKSSDDVPYPPSKIEGIPPDFIMDIDFTEAVKEVLEFSVNDGLENAKILLDGIVESMRTANVEKQLYGVLSLMLAKSIGDYNTLHRLILDSISHLHSEMEIGECLMKALKRQQELCIRLPVPKNSDHLNCSKIMGHLFVMSHEWMDSNSTIQDAILLTVEKWILFNSKGTQIGQTEKENLFLDCFGAFWEVAGPSLMDHNHSFRARIQNEIKAKLLNENVSRPVRERLLDILLELFARCVDTASSQTQTVNRTMIPSSCQVKPIVTSKGTMTKPVQFNDDDDDDFILDKYNEKWEFLASNSPVEEFIQLPEKSGSLTRLSDNISSLTFDSPADLSKHSSNPDTSVYFSANESFNLDTSDRAINISNPLLGSSSGIKTETSDTKVLKSTQAKAMEKSFSSIVKSSNVKSSSQKPTVSETKSASGRSIVDWFDYEPESDYSVTVKKSEKVKTDVTHCSPHIAVDKSESYACDASKKEGDDVEQKYPEMGQQNSKSAKSRNKNKKNKKSSPNKDSATSTPDKESYSRTSLEESVQSLHIADYCPSEDNLDKAEVDWWEKEDKGGLMDNIYVDTGPDVIIEDEEEEIGSQAQKLDTGPAGDAAMLYVDNNKANNAELHIAGRKDSDIKGSGVNHDNPPSMDISVEQLMDEGIQKMDDEYAFETDSDDDFDSYYGAMNYEDNFPVSDLSKKVPTLSASASDPVLDDSYDRDFPRSNLREYLPPPREAEQPKESRTRWVPGKRICLNCHADDHTTANCPKGFLLLQ